MATKLDWSKLEELLKDLGPALSDAVTLLIGIFAGGKKSAAPKAVKCGPDGCDDCGVCLDCAICCQTHALAATIQAKQVHDGTHPKPVPEPVA